VGIFSPADYAGVAFCYLHSSTIKVVFEDVLQTLGLVDCEDPLTAMVAKSLIEYAKAGVLDPDRLKALTVQAFTQQQQQQIQRKRR